jgi:hypothetical protein
MHDHIADILLQILDQLKYLHFQTKSHARHKALGKLYDSLSDLVDEFIEVYMGKYGRVKTHGTIHLANLGEVSIDHFMDEVVDILCSFTKAFPSPDDSDLLNIRDEMLGKVNRTKYLLTLE